MRHWAAIAAIAFWLVGQNTKIGAQTIDEKGDFTLHLLLHPIGTESYQIVRDAPSGALIMNSHLEYSDRGRKSVIASVLRMKEDFTPERFEVKRTFGSSTNTDTAEAHDGTATVHEGQASRDVTLPPRFFVGFGYIRAATQMMMVRYWTRHGKPSSLPILRANPAATTQAAQIRFEGRETIEVGGHRRTLQRYTVANVVFGREVLWFSEQGQLAAAMNFACGLPFEIVRKEYEPALSQLMHDGVTQELRDLAELEKQVPPIARNTFAITGAILVDGTDHPPVANSVVIIRGGRIAAVGKRGELPVPRNVKVIDATGQTLMPGLWEMHTHFSGVEFGPAMLAAGITTARDCGGDFDFLTAIRDGIERQHRLGPRLLLAGLVDASGPDAFGAVRADTPAEAQSVVARYKAAGFQQIKLYTSLKPEVVEVLAKEAHLVGMTVTGHVPSALNAITGVKAGMDQINHLGFVTPVLRDPPKSQTDSEGMDLNSERAKEAILFFQEHHTVIDPTASWGEMAGHPQTVDVASFEPGITKAPFTLSTKFMSLGNSTTAVAIFQQRIVQSEQVIGVFHKANIPIVAGSDTGLLGYGLYRELELYVKAGMTPLEAIQSATIVPARAMNLAAESGTIEPGKRADVILVDGNPLENISDIRKVSRVVTNGRMYESAPLWKSVGFQP